MAIRFSCGRAWWVAVLWANTKNVTNLPWYHVIAMCTPACFCMSLRGAERRGNPHPRRGSKKQAAPWANTQGVTICPGRTELPMRTRCKFLHVIARSEATWQSVLLAAVQNKKQYLGRIRKVSRIRPRYCQPAKFPCGDADCRTSVRTGSQ